MVSPSQLDFHILFVFFFVTTVDLRVFSGLESLPWHFCLRISSILTGDEKGNEIASYHSDVCLLAVRLQNTFEKYTVVLYNPVIAVRRPSSISTSKCAIRKTLELLRAVVFRFHYIFRLSMSEGSVCETVGFHPV